MSEDVSKFLEQVRELGDRRAEEDEARSRELEEKILADRKERQARRAERARSISPQKSSPVNTPPPSAQRPTTPLQRLDLEASPSFEPPKSPQTPSHTDSSDAMATQNFYSTSASKENESPFDAENKRASNPLSPSRSATVRGLSWQRRPNSQASNGTRSRPLSMVAAENAARSSTTPSEPTSATEAVSRDQISQALSSKDPSWFRQTSDRGASSAAYRKNQVEDEDRTDTSAMSGQLHGLARRPSTDPTKDDSDSRPNSGAPPGLLGSPLSLSTSQRLDPPKTENTMETDSPRETQALASPLLGRTSPVRSDRPNSPTKGLGGFVQSAMMKRSDSVNKRWSLKSPEGLQRNDTIASNRNSYIGPRGSISLGRDQSFDGIPRPGSSSSRPGSSQGIKETAAEDPASTQVNEAANSTEAPQEPEAVDEEKMTPPTSPSKTMDPRRWSPTKASWLESALNKPESPKPKATPAPVNQPPWMAEIAKAKAQKAANPSGELSRAPTVSHKHQVSIGGLARASAPGVGARPLSIVGASGAASPITPQWTGYGSSRKGSVDTSATGDAHAEVVKPTERARAATTAANTKPKPEAPPKTDFRASLQSRPPPKPDSVGPADFKNVFGNLRKTTTQNYVAPDELKGNILRGKAGLNVTGGPKKTERVDEFKEAILSKKKDFSKAQSEGRGVTRNLSSASEQPVPEGLVKSFELGRSKSIKRDSATLTSTPFGVGRKSISSTERPNFHERQASTQENPMPDRRPSIGIQRESASAIPTSKPIGTAAHSSTLPKETGAPGRLPGKLANRFNPGLAGLLARGPPSMATGASNNSNSAGDGLASGEPASGPKLTHMTKGRARGPKRKAPTSVASTTAPTSIGESSIAAAEPSEAETVTPAEPETPADSISAAAPPQAESVRADLSQKDAHQGRPKPQPLDLVDSNKQGLETTSVESTKAPSPLKTRVRSKSRVFEQVAALAAQRATPSPTKQESPLVSSQPPSPRKLDMKRVSRFGGDFSPDKSPERESYRNEKTPTESAAPKPLSIKPASPIESKPEVRSPPVVSAGRPLPEPEKISPQPALETTKDQRLPSPQLGSASGGRALPSPPPVSSTSIKTSPFFAAEQPISSRPLPTPRATSPRPLPSPVRSPTKQAIEVSSVLTDFFGSNRARRDYQVDSADVLMRRPNISAPRIQTLSAQLFHFSADGKKTPVPAHNDRVLFEQEMYLCSHTFKNEAGKKTTEVYFWSGDEVPAAVVEDASIFVAREARALGGTLVRLQQNKETTEFLAALGGIVITRRGSSNKYDSLAPHMMCGRRYLGQLVFDEVDFNSAALCSGFPYLITSSGKCYLWKGKGSGADELSCARLVGMDYALTGELEEIEDGQEPESFWTIFGGNKRQGSADHWRLKPNYDKYCSRLFRSEATSKQQIVEIAPFSQKDLDQTGIFVLDAFFELYIIVGARAQPQYASFHNALEFAQEFAILAAGMEDRPFVPVSTVILEGIPRDLKSVFRKWQDTSSPTIMNPSGGGTGLRRGRSLRIMPLNTALQALRE
ncbi:hypothetical protein PFICI_11639 [Pestalotiopsis fici W106-1]|uniref:DUF4045 domain-containing protein n=1 Tax=Pestalotiopsis fici (strain W106-1 / CGMCC3.15140) TaxID=1229662 RepID=W3WT00_PESFW|nr:uncharacterized protein PFICI_11639 [Pestalotiopsis fici W106-1]ETS76252.1 hypothetical protein PFICI_11639 [Pestalotiopsis fici W106-1]